MASFGETLKRERELRNISLREVSEATKIGLRYLEALEANRFDQLPGGLFNKGFIRAYAKFIGLDAETLVNTYLFDISHQKDPEPAPPRFTGIRFAEDPEEAEPGLPRVTGRQALRIGLAALGGLVLVAGFWWIFSSARSGVTGPADPVGELSRASAGELAVSESDRQDPQANVPAAEIPPPDERLGVPPIDAGPTERTQVEKPDIGVEEEPGPGSRISSAAKEQRPDPDLERGGSKPKTISNTESRRPADPALPPSTPSAVETPPGRPVPESAGNRVESPLIASPAPRPEPEKPDQAAEVPPTPRAVPPPERMVLTVSTRVPASVSVSCNGVVKFDGNLPSGKVFALFCAGEIRLCTSDAGSTTLKIDGRTCLPLGKKGRPLRDFLLDRARADEFCPPAAGR